LNRIARRAATLLLATLGQFFVNGSGRQNSEQTERSLLLRISPHRWVNAFAITEGFGAVHHEPQRQLD
jgi:hypothetical protein